MEKSQTNYNSQEIISLESVNKEDVKAQILEIRGYRVMLDKDIAVYFGVTTGNLNKAMKRNIERFPQSFCFQLTNEECSRFQFGILNGSRGSNIKYLPYVYTEQGVAMLTSALHTDRAIEASIQIIEAFVEMSHYLKQNRQFLPYDEIKTLALKQYSFQKKFLF
jgi:phage regulator Rha-like protein